MWTEICGHEAIKQSLQQVARRQQPAQAYLFAGPAGVGKKMLARAFVAALLCQRRDGTPCGVCPSCQRLAAGGHPDVMFVAREGQNIAIQQVRHIIQQARFAPYYGPWRVCILPEAESLSIPAANSMLKIMEEPPPYLVFILVSSRPDAILPTIVSRCQRITFAPLPASAITALLVKQGVEQARAAVAARLSGGRPGRAMALAAEGGLVGRDEAVACLVEVWERGMTAAWPVTEKVAKQERDEVDAFLQFAALWLRDILVLKVSGDRSRLFNVDRATQAARCAREIDLAALLGLLARVSQARWAVAHNANVRLQLEALLAYWAQQRPLAWSE